MRVALVPLLLVACAGSGPAPAPAQSSPGVAAKSAPPSAPTLAADAVAPSRLQASFRNTCFLQSNGAVVCWGTGALFDIPPFGKTLPTPIRPVTIGGLADATQIAITSYAGCALRSSGELWCWGAVKNLGGAVMERAAAKPVSGLAGIVRIFGGDQICAIEASGQLACLEGPSIKRTKLPVPASEIVDVSGGRDHACLVTRARAVICWGRNSLGELGGEPSDTDPFVRVPKVDDAVRVLASDGYSCALRAAGTMACWGNGHEVPGGYEGGKYPVVTTKEPVPYTALASGNRLRCGLRGDGKVECSGNNAHGQVGNGTTQSQYRAVMVPGVSDAIAVAAGFEHACAARKDDVVFCWGANDQGQVGDGTAVDRMFATKVLGLGGSEPPPPPKPGSGPPLIVPVAKSPVASWREEDVGLRRSIDERWRWSGTSPTAVGVRAAAFKQRGLGLDEAHGLVPIAWPAGTQWIGLDGDDALYVGTKDALLRADGVVPASKGGFTKVLAVPYAVDFVATKGLVVAAQAKTLWVSTDGKSFASRPLKVDVSIEEVYARPDVIGVFGRDAAGDSTLFLSKDQGKSFTKSSFQAERFQQVGQLLWASGCPGAVLSADGATWAKTESYYGPASFAGWGDALLLSSQPHVFSAERLTNLVAPPPPAVPTGAAVASGTPGKCGGGGGLGALGGLGRRRDPGACMGVRCVRGSIGDEPKGAKTEVGFFGDGSCARDDKGRCTDAPWVRAPHVSVGGAMIEVPAGCDAMRVLTAGGIGVLFCASSKTEAKIYTVDKSAKWQSEGTVATDGALDDLTIAADGSLVVHPLCPQKGHEDEPCAPALVRRPVSLGSSGAWRATTTPRALSYRVLAGGEVLVIAQTAADDLTRFDLVVEKPTGKTVLASAIGLADDLLDLAVEPDRIVVTERMSTRPHTKAYVAKDGLVPIVAAPKSPKKNP